jgi:isopentenyl-diphosphate Delta-isomerase
MTHAPAELVVLLDADRKPIGSAEKATVHTANTPLHLAFSCHIFAPDGRVLVTRRALSKKTWPGVWTNSVCGHPAPEEHMEDAVRRRAAFELGLDVERVEMALPDFAYRAVDASGIVENEFCPVFTARATLDPEPRADEVAEWQWAAPSEVLAAATAAPWAFSPWFGWQLGELTRHGIPYSPR